MTPRALMASARTFVFPAVLLCLLAGWASGAEPVKKPTTQPTAMLANVLALGN